MRTVVCFKLFFDWFTEAFNVQEATEVQNLQIADGNPAHNLKLPIYMILPRNFTCPSTVTSVRYLFGRRKHKPIIYINWWLSLVLLPYSRLNRISAFNLRSTLLWVLLTMPTKSLKTFLSNYQGIRGNLLCENLLGSSLDYTPFWREQELGTGCRTNQIIEWKETAVTV